MKHHLFYIYMCVYTAETISKICFVFITEGYVATVLYRVDRGFAHRVARKFLFDAEKFTFCFH